MSWGGLRAAGASFSLVPGAFGLLEGFEGQVLQLGEEFAQAAGVVEPGPVALLLLGGQLAGDGLAVALADPAHVRPVQLGRVGLAPAHGLAAGGGAEDDAARPGLARPAGPGDPPQELAAPRPARRRAVGHGAFNLPRAA